MLTHLHILHVLFSYFGFQRLSLRVWSLYRVSIGGRHNIVFSIAFLTSIPHFVQWKRLWWKGKTFKTKSMPSFIPLFATSVLFLLHVKNAISQLRFVKRVLHKYCFIFVILLRPSNEIKQNFQSDWAPMDGATEYWWRRGSKICAPSTSGLSVE